MQNKANLLDTQTNVTSAHITSYQLPVTNYQYAKQTQTKPICYSNKMNTTFLLTKDYEQITVNNEPIKTNPIKPNYHSWSIFPPHQMSKIEVKNSSNDMRYTKCDSHGSQIVTKQKGPT
jgi:hypothetical protein